VPYYPRHPITERLALTVFPQARPIRVATPPAGVAVSILATSAAARYPTAYYGQLANAWLGLGEIAFRSPQPEPAMKAEARKIA